MGYPAEFREGITHCSDCGSLLSQEKEDTQKPSRRITLTDLHKRILYTIGFVLLYRVLLLIPVPGIDIKALGSVLGDEGYNSLLRFFGYGLARERFSIIALGVLPYLTVYMIIEILSLFIQPLKSWRAEGYQGRIKIRRVALFATFLLAFWQGYSLGHGLENLIGPGGERIVRNPGLSFLLISALTVTAGTFIMIWIAELITRKGIGHGISVLIFVGYGPKIFSNFPQIKWVPDEHSHSPLEYFLLFAVLTIALMVLIVVMEKSFRRIAVKFNDGTEAYIPLKLTSAGVMPVEWTSTLIMLPTTLLLLIKNLAHPNWKLPESLMPPGIWYYVIYFAITIFLYYLFTSFFYDPKKIVTFLKSRQASIVSPGRKKGESYVDRSLEFMVPIAAIYLCTVVFAPNAIFNLFFIFHVDSIGLITVVAIMLDLIEEMRIRRKGNHLAKVAELHDVPMAGLVRSLLEQKGLPCYLRGYYHRALLYFFGPYIEISVLVPEDRVADAKEVVENYFDANILTVQSNKVSESS
jgi:preprotein translocase subunit SecY